MKNRKETIFILLRTLLATNNKSAIEKVENGEFDESNPLCDAILRIADVPSEIVKIASISELYDMNVRIKISVVERIKKLLETGGRLFYEETWSDDANNDIRSVSLEGVFFDDEDSSYPLEDLGFDDAVYILDDLIKREEKK